METKYIITLREAINTGSGVTKLIEADGFGPCLNNANAIEFKCGEEWGLLPMKNISGVYPVKKEQ